MNNQTGGWRGAFVGLKKKKEQKKQSSLLLCKDFEVLFPEDTHTPTKKKLSPFLSLIFSVSPNPLTPSFLAASFISFIFTLGLLQGSLASPSTYHSFAVQALISACRKINSVLCIHFSSYRCVFNKGNKAATL